MPGRKSEITTCLTFKAPSNEGAFFYILVIGNTSQCQPTAEEQENIITFIHALTDTMGLTSAIKKLPKFNTRIIDDRKPGGLY